MGKLCFFGVNRQGETPMKFQSFVSPGKMAPLFLGSLILTSLAITAHLARRLIRTQMRKHLLIGKYDRLSKLPDTTLHHILSYLDTKSMVETGSLSRRFRCLWKDVPVLNFRRQGLRCTSGFEHHVRKILSLRSTRVPIVRFNLDYYLSLEQWDGYENGRVLGKVMQLAASRGHLPNRLSINTESDGYTPFYGMFESINRHQKSLLTLELKGLWVLLPTACEFKHLTSLKLTRCEICGEERDPFAGFPRLKYLKLVNVRTRVDMVVSGPELTELEIRDPYCKGIEVVAPKLESFGLEIRDRAVDRLPKVNLPSLDRANIRIEWFRWCRYRHNGDVTTENANLEFVGLLRSLHNVESLVLCFYSTEVEDICSEIPLAGMRSLMDPKGSPFTRLKTLKVQHQSVSRSVPSQVIRYFFDGSPPSKEKSYVLEKIDKRM